MGLKDIMRSLPDSEVLELREFITDITKRYVEAEHAFLDMAFTMGDQEGMTLIESKDYIRYLADLRLSAIGGFDPLYQVEDNPLPWLDWLLSGRNHTNFFENRVTSYDHNGLVGEIDFDAYSDIVESLRYQ